MYLLLLLLLLLPPPPSEDNVGDNVGDDRAS
jgi:hypothetical protein